MGFIIDKYKVETVIVSFQMNGDEKKREIQQLCLRTGWIQKLPRMRLVFDA
ncbi:MAG: hypothetical protein R2874_04885 [Desulfobacterales bacterium]